MKVRRLNTEKNSGSPNIIKAVFILICMTAMAFGGLVLNEDHAFTQENGAPSITTGNSGSMDFNTCIKLAIEQSPYFKENALEIEVSRLNESDSRWALIPSLTMITTSYVGLEQDSGLKINFGISEYDPFESYFSLKASKIFTEIAVLVHQGAIAEGIYEMAQKFLQLYALSQISDCQDKAFVQHRKYVTFFKERLKAGGATNMDLQIAEKHLAVAQAEREYVSAQRATILEGLRQFLSLEPSQRLDINLQGIREQILGNFDPAAFSLEQARVNSFELKVHEKKKKLQTYKISQAYARFTPKIFVGIHETNPLDATQQDDFYYSVNFRLNLWNGFKDVNDISRQKMVLKKYKNEAHLVEAELSTEWQMSKTALSEAETAMKLTRLNEDYFRLKEQQGEINYGANRISQSTLLEHRIAHLEARKECIQKAQNYEEKVLKIRYLSGDLFNSFIKVAPCEE